MKKIIILSSLIFFLFQSCDYLDIVPDNTAVLDDAFRNESTTEDFLHSCYYNIPDYRSVRNNASWCTTPEYVGTSEWISDWFNFLKIQQGKYSASGPVVDYWSQCYQGIRQCYILLDNIENVTPVSITHAAFEEKKKQWRAEAQFLIAYYHYILLLHYGPVPIVEELIDFTQNAASLQLSRKPYDECVELIADMFESSIEDLPITLEVSAYGKPTKATAKALISRMYIYAASPLFNGNSRLYVNFKDKEGNNLVSQNPDKNKWKIALDKTETAIQYAEAGNRSLYRATRLTAGEGTDFDIAVDINRYVMTDAWNSELIWGYSNNREAWDFDSYQRHVIPRIAGSEGDNTPYGAMGPSLDIVKLFHTEDGLPIDLDPDYNYNDIFTVLPGDNTAYLHRKREPRFYAWIGYDQGKYPVNNYLTLSLKCGEEHGVPLVNGSPNLSRDQYYSGYAPAKGIHPNAQINATTKSIVSYPWPLFRLAELYLNYAEAYVEYHGKLDGKALEYVNAIRDRAGIPNIEVSYAKVGGLPSGNELVKVIRKEKTIEFLFEGHMAYDYRRWMTAHIEWAELSDGMKGLNCTGTTMQDFYKETLLITQPYIFTSKQYLFPIVQTAIDINKNLVQNPGWGTDILPELVN